MVLGVENGPAAAWTVGGGTARLGAAGQRVWLLLTVERGAVGVKPAAPDG
jgi:hypothetical protein